jgi:hypothetical protein
VTLSGKRSRNTPFFIINTYVTLWLILLKIDENNIVTQVIVVANEDTTDTNGVEVEEIGVAFCKKLLGAETNWKQTSYNNNFRVRYAGNWLLL